QHPEQGERQHPERQHPERQHPVRQHGDLNVLSAKGREIRTQWGENFPFSTPYLQQEFAYCCLVRPHVIDGQLAVIVSNRGVGVWTVEQGLDHVLVSAVTDDSRMQRGLAQVVLDVGVSALVAKKKPDHFSLAVSSSLMQRGVPPARIASVDIKIL